MPIAAPVPEVAVVRRLWPCSRITPDTCHGPAHLARQALVKEVELTPKPGLVDRRNSGAHRDMDIDTFRRSIAAIAGGFSCFYDLGHSHATMGACDFLPLIRQTGMVCEQAMFRATGGINTHKGGIFAFGLLCAAAGRLQGRGDTLDTETICSEGAAMCATVVADDLQRNNHATTVGEHLYRRFGLTGARGEAASGYATVREKALPAYRQAQAEGCDEETALLQALLCLLAHNRDTNVVARGGLDGLAFVRKEAQKLLQEGGMFHPNGRQRMITLDESLIARNLSPGGSADLLAVTWFLAQYP